MIIIKNVRVINFNPPEVSEPVDVVIDKNLILDIGRYISGNYSAEDIIDGQGKYISPGLVCAHNHFYSALSRGIIANIPPSSNFQEILKNLWWRLDRALDEESLYYSGIVGALEAIKTGTTSVIDHSASPNYIKGSLTALKNCFEKVGLRGILCYEVTDRNGDEGMIAGIDESKAFAELVGKDRIEKNNTRLVEAAIGAHASFTISDETLTRLAAIVKESGKGIHIHVAEDLSDEVISYNNYELSVIERLEKAGALNDKSILAHGVHLSDKEIDIINSFDSFLVHNPRSNMNNSIGFMKKLSVVKNVALGTDGIGSNMFEEMKIGYFKNQDAGNSLYPADYLQFLFNGNKILSRYFNQSFGKIETGKVADMVMYDYQSPTPLNEKNLAGHFIFGFSSRDVETVIVNGKIVYRDRTFTFDVKPIYESAQAAAQKLWTKINSI
ncbi:MAG: putative aminohydrolase SsnA [Ignavibacteriales bacterium]|nr:MAG: putative aminohydrolase SsnA [Ignavibacteriales bacterium]